MMHYSRVPISSYEVYPHHFLNQREGANDPQIYRAADLFVYVRYGQNIGAVPIRINGMPDHVHLLVKTSKALSDA